MAIKAVVFDIGGVLEYTPPLGTVARWEHKLGLQPGDMSRLLHEVWKGGSIGTITLDEVHRRIGDILKLDADTVNAFMEDTWVEYVGTLNVELRDYVQSLRPRYKTGIISNSFVGAREREQAHYQFEELVDDIVYSHEVGLSKPDRRIFELACERLGVLPSEMIFVDDVEPNIVAARDMGIHAILFRDNAQTIAEIEALLLQ